MAESDYANYPQSPTLRTSWQGSTQRRHVNGTAFEKYMDVTRHETTFPKALQPRSEGHNGLLLCLNKSEYWANSWLSTSPGLVIITTRLLIIPPIHRTRPAASTQVRRFSSEFTLCLSLNMARRTIIDLPNELLLQCGSLMSTADLKSFISTWTTISAAINHILFTRGVY